MEKSWAKCAKRGRIAFEKYSEALWTQVGQCARSNSNKDSNSVFIKVQKGQVITTGPVDHREDQVDTVQKGT